MPISPELALACCGLFLDADSWRKVGQVAKVEVTMKAYPRGAQNQATGMIMSIALFFGIEFGIKRGSNPNRRFLMPWTCVKFAVS